MASQPPPLRAPRVARVLLIVSDALKSAEWYKEVLGIEPAEVREDPPHVVFDTQGTILVLHRGRTQRVTDPIYVHFRVDDFDSAVAWLRGRGVELGEVFQPAPDLRIVNFPDPDGHMLGIEGR